MKRNINECRSDSERQSEIELVNLYGENLIQLVYDVWLVWREVGFAVG